MKLIILDRDGTINVDSNQYVKSADEWIPLPGALEAIAALNQAGWLVVVATNQAGLGRGLFDVAALNAMHSKMYKLLAQHGGKVEAVFYCPHAPDEGCHCRKPSPGLFEQILQRYGLEGKNVHVVGDHVRDLQAGAQVGCIPHLVLTGKGVVYRDKPLNESFPVGTQVHADLAAFAGVLLSSAA